MEHGRHDRGAPAGRAPVPGRQRVRHADHVPEASGANPGRITRQGRQDGAVLSGSWDSAKRVWPEEVPLSEL